MSDGKEARIGGELGEVPGGGDKLFQAFSTTLCEDWHTTCRVTIVLLTTTSPKKEGC